MEEDLFFCKLCGHEEMMEDPLETEKCPNCETMLWDRGEAECFNCNHSWIPKGLSKICPSCGKELSWWSGKEKVWKHGYKDS